MPSWPKKPQGEESSKKQGKSPSKREAVTRFVCSCGETWDMYTKSVSRNSMICPACGGVGKKKE